MYLETVRSLLTSFENEMSVIKGINTAGIKSVSDSLLNLDYKNNIEILMALNYEYSIVTVFALILIMFNLLFKLTAAPFHF